MTPTVAGSRPSRGEQLDQVRDMLTTRTSISTDREDDWPRRQAIYRLKDDPAWAEGVLRDLGGLAFH